VFLCGALGVGTGPALAQISVGGVSDSPLPGSQFQGGDGNQDNGTDPVTGAPLIDWHGLQADGRVGQTSDPQAEDNVFAGGAKEDQPDGWGITTLTGGSTPGSGNVLDIYRAIDRPPGGGVFLYLAFTRFAGNGTVFVTFELNQDSRLWLNSAGSMIPCRTTGDLLISFDAHGNTAEVLVDRWVTTGQASNRCATAGTLVADTTLQPNVDIQAAFNYTSAINNWIPDSFFSVGSNTIPQLQFGEAAINLTSALGEVGDGCRVFGSTWMHSRSSLSENSGMQDYVAPEAFRVNTCPATPSLTSASSGRVNRRARGKNRLRRHAALTKSLSISDTATLSGGDMPTGTITFKLFGPNNADCSGAPVFTDTATVAGNGSYQSAAFPVTAIGTYRWVVAYSGDDNNRPAGPTACGVAAETVGIVKATPTLTSTASGPRGRRRIATGPRRHRRRRTARVHTGRATQPIYDTAVLDGGIAPRGTITFRLYGPDDEMCSRDPIFTSTVDVNGNGPYNSDPYTPPVAGTYRWVVSYSGDANNNPAGPTACGDLNEIAVISKAQPAIMTAAPGAVEVGTPIRDSATLSGGSDPTGTITFRVYEPADSSCAGPPAASSTVTVSGNGSYHSDPFTPSGPGTYRWVASYSGDPNNGAVATSCGDPGEVVFVPPPPAQPALTTTASAGAPAGSPIFDTAHLSGGSGPTGSITFDVYGPDNSGCASPPAGTSTVTVSGNGDYRSRPFTPTQPGTYRWIATYHGDEHNKPAGPTLCDEAGESVGVSKANPTLFTFTVPAVPIGGEVHDLAVLRAGSMPTGNMTFELFGPNDATCAAAPVYSVEQNVIGNGAYPSPGFAPRETGSYQWVATYSGDNNNAGATTQCGASGETVIVLPRQPLLTTSASPPGNLHKGRRVRAGGLSDYDAAALNFGFEPTGTITFRLFGPGDVSCSGSPVFTSAADVDGNGVYNSERFTPTASGTYRWDATYSGDSHNNSIGPTSCADPAEHVRVTLPADPQFTTTASDAVPLGGAIHDTAHLSSGDNPSGTIAFKLYGPADTDCTGRPVFTSTVAVDGNGDYTSGSFVATAAGAYRWLASYSGDAANHPAGTTCSDPTETTVVRPPNITPVTPAFSTTASQPTGVGAPLSDTAHISGGTDPGGAITFELFGPDDQTCSRPPVFTDPVAVTGNGNFDSSAFVVQRPGTYRWVATYSGDAMNTPAGPTICGDSAETVSVSATPGGNPDEGPNVPTPPKPKPQPKPKPPSPPPPAVTG
jgi:hypothetical protein